MICTIARLVSVPAVVVVSGVVAGLLPHKLPAAEVDFAREIQPLLARRCFACHGPDTQEAGLRLDEAASATAELDSGMTAVVAGDAAASELLARIQSDDEFLQMPPEGPRLTADEVAVIRRWIDEGAAWEKHWAFRPLVRPEVPVGESVSPPAAHSPPAANPIDAFVRHGLAQQGLPVPERADKLTLLRRATYSVTGLPPNEAEVRDFLADESPDAWEKVVDRLLASPHYGEHWARHWLDLVRYAETNSFERDNPKPHVWRYRDYVIRSFNDDKPYDRFVTEQLAGDELPEPRPDDYIATGYYRLGLWDDEPADRLQATYDGFDDIVATTGQTFLGLTINCARCHDHKIDPISQKDYYSLLSFFHNLTPMGNPNPNIERPIFASDAARQEYEEKAAALGQRRNEAQKAVTQVEQQVRRAWQRDQAGSTAGGDLDDLRFRFYRDTWETLPVFDELKPEDVGIAEENLFDITIAPSLRPEAFGYVFEGFLKVPVDGDYTFVLDSDDGSRLSINDEVVITYDGIHGEGRPQTATVSLPAGRLPIRLDYFQWKFGQGLSLSWSGPGVESRPLSAMAGTADGKTFDFAKVIRSDGARLLGEDGLADYRQKKKQLQALLQEQVPIDRALVVTERGAQAPETYVFYRGNPHAEPTPENLVEPAFLEVLDPPQPEIVPPADGESTGRRLALAKWMTSPDNPLTARVIINRLWQHHFGRGIVRSASNFGFAGDPPTHPELLDWLACELIDAGWHLKALHKIILMSEAYRASSAVVPDALAADPLNDSLWRFDMRRLAAEEIRDSIHVASGAFNPAMYGPSMYPEIPPAVMATQSRPGSGWGDSSPEERARRSVYAHVKRSLLVPILSDFDLADTDTTCPVRFVTTQPTQALGMMNGSFLQKQAKVFAERVKQEVGGPDAADEAAMVRRALEIALVRPATDEEVARGVELIDTLEATDGVHPSRALEIYCLMVLNLNEFVYLD